jgi:hypothetical protein
VSRRGAVIAWTARAALLAVFAVALYGAIDPRHNHAAAAPPPDAVEHIIYGYLLTLLTIAAAPRLSPWLIGAAFLGIGVVFEATQAVGLVAGTAQWQDLVSNLAGVVAALAPLALGRLRRPISSGGDRL